VYEALSDLEERDQVLVYEALSCAQVLVYEALSCAQAPRDFPFFCLPKCVFGLPIQFF
jgi:hypothetical protein